MPFSFGHRAEFLDVVDAPKRVGRVNHREQLDLVGQQSGYSIHVQGPILADRDVLQGSPFPLTEHLPRNDVGVVFHPRDEDLVPFGDVRIAPGRRHEVHRLGGPACEDDLFNAARIHELLDRLAGAFPHRGRFGTDSMSAAVHIRVVHRIVAVDRVDHHPRFLRRRRIVQIHQGLITVDGAEEDRELFPDRSDIEGRGRCHRHHMDS